MSPRSLHPLFLAALVLPALTSCHISNRGVDFSPLTDPFAPVKEDEVVLEGNTTSISTPIATPPDVVLAKAEPPVLDPTPELTPALKPAATSRPAPALTPAPAALTPAAAPKTRAATGSTYVVKAGDTLGGIAYRSRTTVPQLCAANGLKPTSTLKIGQKLRLPAAGNAATAPAAKKSGLSLSKLFGKPKTKGRTHTIKSGETLYAVARKYGVTPAALMQANKLTPQTATKLRVGSTLTIPAK